MMPGPNSVPVPEPLEQAVRRELEQILQSSVFAGSPRLKTLLEHIVDVSLRGHQGELKEYAIATEAFDRAPDFDPKNDTIVRVQARRLRQKLAAYYEHEGLTAELVIEIPKGSYTAKFVPRPVGMTATASKGRNRWMRVALYASCSLALLAAALLSHEFASSEQPLSTRSNALRRFRLAPDMGAAHPTISADGRYLLFLAAQSLAKRSLWIWDLEDLKPRALGAEGAWGYGMSPDGREVAAVCDGELRVYPTSGGPARRVCDVPGDSAGLRWSWDAEVIVFVSGNPSRPYVVSAFGGSPEPLLSDLQWQSLIEQFGPEVVPRAATPYFLPLGDDRRVVVFAMGKNSEQKSLVLHDLDRGETKILGPGGLLPRYSAVIYLTHC